MKHILTILFITVFGIGISTGQTITAKVIDKINNEPIINASIKVVGTNALAITDINGKFKIKAKSGSHLEINHLSFKKRTVVAKEGMTIILESANINLDEIVVKSHPLDDISHSIVITDRIKKGSQARSLADLFNDVPGFSLQKRSSMASEPSFRSFKYEEMNVKYDGGAKIVHACPNRMDPITAHVIPEEVNKIEVIKGPFTVRYGQRFGATVNMVTKPIIQSSLGIHGSVEGGYESNGNNIVGRAQIQYIAKKFDVTLNGEHRDFGNYKDGDGTLVPASFKTQSYSIKLGIKPADNQRLQLDYRAKYGSDIKHAGLPMDSPMDDSYLMSLDYKIDDLSDKVSSLLFKAYYSDVDHLMDNKLRPSFKFMYARTPVVSNTMGGKFEIGLTPSSRLLVYAGLDADIIKRDGKRFVTVKLNPVGVPVEPNIEREFNVWHEATSQDFGIFTEANYKLSDYLTANIGARIDLISAGVETPDPGFAKLYNGKIDDVSESNIGGNISLKYKRNDLQLQFAYGRGTRSASMVERYIYRFSIGSDPRDYIGNPYLKPEINNQIELSATKYFDKFSIGSSVFYSYMKNYITARINSGFTDTSGGCGGTSVKAPKQFWNVDAYQYGVDGFVSYNIFDALKLSADMAYTYAQNITFDEPLAQIAPLTAHIGLKWETEKYWIDFRSRLTSKQNRFAPSFKETETPGYSILDLRVGYKPINGLTIGAAAMNILDKSYYNHLNFSYKNSNENEGKIFEIGRSFSLYIKYKF